MESPNLWTSCIILFLEPNFIAVAPTRNKILLLCFLIHYINRSIIFPLRMSSDRNPMPLSVMLLAFSFCTWNGFNQSISLILLSNSNPIPSQQLGYRFAFGIFLFWVGFSLNVSSDEILRQARDKSKLSSNRRCYVIPRGGLFEYISCANYCET
jgi:hypothetical protein